MAIVACTVVALFFCRHILTDLDHWGIQDWDQHLFLHEVPRKTILEFGQFPLWNPYYCGGTVMLANPQSTCLAPWFGLVLALGTVRGVKFAIVLHYVIGLMGTWVLCRQTRQKRRAGRAAPAIAFFPAIAFMLNSMHSLGLTVGMTWLMSVAYLPWVVWSYAMAHGQLLHCLIASLALCLMFLSGGVYPVAITLLFLALLAATDFCRVGYRRAVAVMVLTSLLASGASAVKLVPAVVYLKRYPRKVSDYSGFSVQSLAHSLTGRHQTLAAGRELGQDEGFWRGMSYGMDENGSYTGWLVLGLAMLGLLRDGRRHWRLALCAAVFLWLAFGDRAAPSLWRVLRCLPIYDSMRVAQRFRIVFAFCLALFAGSGLRWLVTVAGRRWGKGIARLISVAALSLVLLDLTVVSSRTLADAFTIPPVRVPRAERFRQIAQLPVYGPGGFRCAPDLIGTEAFQKLKATRQERFDSATHDATYLSWSAMFPAVQANLGCIDGYETATTIRNAIPQSSEHYRGEVHLEDAEGSVSVVEWTPNRMTFMVEASGPGRVVVNQNYYPGWYAETERSLRAEPCRGLLSAAVRPSDRMVTFRYAPASFDVGLALTSLTFACAVGWLYLHSKRPAGTRGCHARPGGHRTSYASARWSRSGTRRHL